MVLSRTYRIYLLYTKIVIRIYNIYIYSYTIVYVQNKNCFRLQKIKQPPAALLAKIEQNLLPSTSFSSSSSSGLDFNSNENSHSVELDLQMPSLDGNELLQPNLTRTQLVRHQMRLEWENAFRPVSDTQLL